jgi:hypothetical protein
LSIYGIPLAPKPARIWGIRKKNGVIDKMGLRSQVKILLYDHRIIPAKSVIFMCLKLQGYQACAGPYTI